jgi:hypothetical protein
MSHYLYDVKLGKEKLPRVQSSSPIQVGHRLKINFRGKRLHTYEVISIEHIFEREPALNSEHVFNRPCGVVLKVKEV